MLSGLGSVYSQYTLFSRASQTFQKQIWLFKNKTDHSVQEPANAIVLSVLPSVQGFWAPASHGVF